MCMLGMYGCNMSCQTARVSLDRQPKLTKTEASTILTPATFFIFRLGSTTPYDAPMGDILEVPTGCHIVCALAAMYESSPSSTFVESNAAARAVEGLVT